MCRTVHAVLQTLICGVQMLVRVLMTVLLMIENLIRMILQTLYNFISFMLQLLSLIPICVVFLVSARLKCFMCGGGGGCQPGRGGACDCIMSLVAIVILFFIFKSTGVMDKIFYSMGYAKAAYEAEPYVPTPGDITECSRNDTDQDIEYFVRTETYTTVTETSAAAYLDTLVQNYIEKIVTKPKFVPPEPESTYVSTNIPVEDNMITSFTSSVVDGISLLSTVATAITEAVETVIDTSVDTEAPEVAETEPTATTTTTTTSENIFISDTLVKEAVEAITSTDNEVVDTLHSAAKGSDMEMYDISFNTANEALDMGITDTPNAEESTETTNKTIQEY